MKVILHMLSEAGLHNLPSIEQVLAARDQPNSAECPCWDVSKVMQGETQSDESFAEQKEALQAGDNVL